MCDGKEFYVYLIVVRKRRERGGQQSGNLKVS